MTSKKYRIMIEYRVNYINKRLGKNYYADYCSIYGGWNLYMIDEKQRQYRGVIGFDCRKSSSEMLNYVDGIYDNNNFAEVYYSDWENTLEEFEKLMGIKVKGWEVSGCGYNYRVEYAISAYSDGYYHDVDGEEITGKYLWRYLMGNVWDDINPRKVYHTKEWDREKSDYAKKRTSRILRQSWKDCPLSGMCYDYDILEPIVEYMSKPYEEDYTLDDLVHECLDSFFSARQKEIEYYNSYEGVKQWLLECDDNEYYENGKVFDGVLVEE